MASDRVRWGAYSRGERRVVARATLGGRAVDDPRLAPAAVSHAHQRALRDRSPWNHVWDFGYGVVVLTSLFLFVTGGGWKSAAVAAFFAGLWLLTRWMDRQASHAEVANRALLDGGPAGPG
jgi:hypothetical protein